MKTLVLLLVQTAAVYVVAPTLHSCTLSPTTGVAYRTVFEVQCDGSMDGQLTYTLYYASSPDKDALLLPAYRGSSPNAAGIVLPSGEQWLTVTVENSDHTTTSIPVAQVNLTSNLLPVSELQQAIQNIKDLVKPRMEYYNALIKAHLVLRALNELSEEDKEIVNMKTTLLDLVYEQLHAKVKDQLDFAESMLVKGTSVSIIMPVSRRFAQLASISRIGYRQFLFMHELEQVVVSFLRVYGRILAEKRPSEVVLFGVSRKIKIEDIIHKSIRDIVYLQSLMRPAGEVTTITTPHVTLSTWKALPGMSVSPTLNLSGILVELPQAMVNSTETRLISAAHSPHIFIGPPSPSHQAGEYSSGFLDFTVAGMENVSSNTLFRHWFPRSLSAPDPTVEFILAGPLVCTGASSCGWTPSNSSGPISLLVLGRQDILVTISTIDNSTLGSPPPVLHVMLSERGVVGQVDLPLNETKLLYRGVKIKPVSSIPQADSYQFLLKNIVDFSRNISMRVKFNTSSLGESCGDCPGNYTVLMDVRVERKTALCSTYYPPEDRYIAFINKCISFPKEDSSVTCECEGSGIFTTMVGVPPTVMVTGVPVGGALAKAVPVTRVPMTGDPDKPVSLSGVPVTGITMSGLPMSGNLVTGVPVIGEHVTGVPMTGVPMSGELVTGVPVTGEHVTGMPTTGVPVSGEIVTGVPVTGEHVTGVPIAGVPVTGEHVTGVPVTGVALSGVPVSGEPVTGVPMTGEPVTGVPVTGVAFSGVPVSGEPVTGVPVTGDPVTGVPVTGVALSGVPVSGEPLTGMPVTGITMTGVPITGELVTGVPVTGESVTGVPVTGVPLTGEPLTGISINGVTVTGMPVTSEPVTGEPVTGEPVTDKPVIDKPKTREPVARECNKAPQVFMYVLVLVILVGVAAAIVSDYCDRPKVEPLTDPHLNHLEYQYNVFVYTSLLKWFPGTSSDIGIHLKSDTYGTEKNFVQNPGVQFGQMVHVVVCTGHPTGRIQQVSIILLGVESWRVDRVVVNDPFWQEVVLFLPPACVQETHTWDRVSIYDRNNWRESLLQQMVREICSRLPVLLAVFPPKVRLRKLDRTMTYVLGLAVWVLVWSLLSARVIAIVPKVTINFFIMLLSVVVIETVITYSLRFGESGKRWWPWPRSAGWCLLMARFLLCVVGMALLAYIIYAGFTFSCWRFNQLCQVLVEGFLWQLASLLVIIVAAVITKACYYCRLWTYGFHAKLVNPEGMFVPCQLPPFPTTSLKIY